MKSSSSSVSANILSFDGLKHLRQLQYSKLNKKVAALQYEKAKNDLYLNITAYFLETLCAKENIGNCKNIVESLQKQEEQISIKSRLQIYYRFKQDLLMRKIHSCLPNIIMIYQG